MDVERLDERGMRIHEIGDRTGSGTGFVWVDIPEWSDEAEAYLRDLGCHEMVVESCRTRNHVPTMHAYADHAFITTQSPLLGHAGHVHLLELDQIIGRRLPGHGPRPAQPGRGPGRGTRGDRRGPPAHRVRPVPSDDTAGAVLRHHLGGRAPPARA